MKEKIRVKKVHMTQMWRGDTVIPVTVLKLKGESDKELELFGGLKEGAIVAVSGVSKGKGFQGVVKRHGFGGGPRTHGQKNRLRAPGSIGATAPQRVIKGRKMAGHMGHARVTIKNLTVVETNAEAKTVLVKGGVPGPRGASLEIRP